MDLSSQFKVILVCYFYGFLFMISYEIFNRIFYYKKGKLIRLIFEVIFFIIHSIIFFVLMLLTNNAIFNIFIFLFLLLGAITYFILLKPYMIELIDQIYKVINKKLLHIRLKIKAKCDKIKLQKRKKKRYEKNHRTKTNSK